MSATVEPDNIDRERKKAGFRVQDVGSGHMACPYNTRFLSSPCRALGSSEQSINTCPYLKLMYVKT